MLRMKLTFAFVLLYLLTGCTPTLLFTGVSGTGATLSKEKTVGSSVDDYNIWTKIKAAFLEHHKEVENILTNISVEVSEGRVLLTGFVNTADERLIVLKLVWQQNGVREVINEIKLKGEHGGNSIKQYGNDSWITAQVKSKMLLNEHVKSINYNIETINGTVYILGIARTNEEFNAIKDIAENVKGVEKFVSYIRLKDDKEIKQDGKVQVGETKEEAQVITKGEELDENMKPMKEESLSEAKAPKAKEPVQEDGDEDIQIEYVSSDDD